MKLSKKQQFFYTAFAFAVLGAAFNVMVLVEGFTEIRPANAIPVVAGLLFGPVGSAGCAVGNLIADCFGTLDLTSLLGMLGNFLAAFIPWKLWRLFSSEKPAVHSYRNLFLYIFLSYLSATTVSWVLGFGLEYFFGQWIPEIYRYVFLNNFGFSLVLGLPLLIVLTSDSIRIEPDSSSEMYFKKKHLFHIPVKYFKILVFLYTAVMTVILSGVFRNCHLGNSVFITFCSVTAALLLLVLTVIPF